jgi:hypothetical protein
MPVVLKLEEGLEVLAHFFYCWQLVKVLPLIWLNFVNKGLFILLESPDFLMKRLHVELFCDFFLDLLNLIYFSVLDPDDSLELVVFFF